MRVTDDQAATLRAQLAGDFPDYERRLDLLDREQAATGYTVLIQAAFFEAALRRFGKQPVPEKVISFVADLRSRTERLAELDPGVAERVIRSVLGDGSVSDIDERARIGVQSVVLARLVADAQFDDAGLDAFMSDARQTADDLLSDDA